MTEVLKSADLGHEGSTPSGPTKFTPYESWAAAMPSSELPVVVGDKRLISIDGFGQMDAEIISVDDDSVEIKIIDPIKLNGSVFRLHWDLGPNTWIGMKLDGEEYKKYMADVETQALATAPDGN